MSEEYEKLSALIDDYADTRQDHALLDAVLDDVNQQYALHRYRLIGEIMRKELPSSLQTEFATRVMSRIAQEPDIHNPRRTSNSVDKPVTDKPGWLASMFKPLAGAAVAASVAVVAIVLLQPSLTGQSSTESIASIESSKARVEKLASLPVITNAVKVSGAPQSVVRQDGLKWKIKRDEPAMQDKLNSYLINHNEHAGSLQGIIPQARVVGFDARP